jgi:hypothetical protein
MIIESSFSFPLSEFILLIFFNFKAWILLFAWDILSNSIIVIRASRNQLFLIGKIILKSLFELMEVWWSVAISISRKCCYIKFLAFGEYFLKANNRGNKIFPINNRFCDLYIKNILDRRSELSSKIIEILFFCIYREVIFQLIKIIGEFYHVLIRPLARIRIFLLVFDLKIEVVIENILKIRHI